MFSHLLRFTQLINVRAQTWTHARLISEPGLLLSYCQKHRKSIMNTMKYVTVLFIL